MAKSQSRVAQAALNNAQWCAAMCRVHGGRNHFADGLWFSNSAMPRFYPNAVTFADGAHAKAHTNMLRKLGNAGLPAGWAVKDSFAALDLVPLGFSMLFEADWLWRAPGLAADNGAAADLQWTRLQDERELAAWQEAWAGGPMAPPIFRAALLDQPDHAILAGRRNGEIVAGCVVSASTQVAGLSNWFARDDEPAALASCLAAVAALFPATPIVDYEQGEALAAFVAQGFEKIGRLRVWRKD